MYDSNPILRDLRGEYKDNKLIGNNGFMLRTAYSLY